MDCSSPFVLRVSLNFQRKKLNGFKGEDGGLPSTNVRDGWSYQTALNSLIVADKGSVSEKVPRLDVDALIVAKRKALQKDGNPKIADDSHNTDKNDPEEDSSDEDSESISEPEDGSHIDMEQDVLTTRSGKETKTIQEYNNGSNGREEDDNASKSGESDDGVDESSDNDEAEKSKAFFDSGSNIIVSDQPIEIFNQLTLSRPLLRGIAAMGFIKPTPIQAAVIPLALAGRDICASAVTGSGKTAAFVLPILERLLHVRYTGLTKAIILTPTRELAAQCLGMLSTFAQFTKLRATLIVGGTKNVQGQAAELRTRPEIIVATPGRLLDHVLNSTGFSLHDVEFLVLDEADRLLDLGFQDEVNEIVKACPKERRQTMLFSATMNTKVDDLINLSLKRPVRVQITDKKSQKSVEVAPRLEQEFIRIRSGNEGLNREGILLALLTRTFPHKTIVFFDTKVVAHRMMILCGLCGIKCTELHGNLTQQQRLTALDDFSNGHVDVLLATDLAARGLDIELVETVINFEMPSQIETYVHRIGRTARAGRGGRSCTLIGEGRRHLMKEIIKDAETKRKTGDNDLTGVIRSRSVPSAVVSHFVEKIQALEPHVEEVMQAEAIARTDRIAEMEAIRAQNLIEHADDIKNRPAREWFTSNQEKQKRLKEIAEEKKRLIAEKVGTGEHRMTRKKRRAREALNALSEKDQAPDDDEDVDGVVSKPREAKIAKVNAAIRKQKKEKIVKANHKLEMSINEQIESKSKKAKAKSPAGDSRLFDEEKVAFAPKQAKKVRAAEDVVKSGYNFRGYIPDRKLGVRKGSKKFKSKAKYRRR